MKTVWRHIGWFCVPILISLLSWEAVSRSGWVNPLLFPPPSAVGRALWNMISSGIIIADSGISLWRVLVGLGLGALLGVSIGLLTGRSEIINRALSPLIHVLRPLPPVAIIPLVIVWLGIGDTAKIFSIGLAAFFPVWLSTHTGARQIPQEFLWSADLLTDSRFIIFLRVVLPASMPFIVAGIRTAIATAFVMVFVSELAGAESGLGYRISITQLAYRVDQMMAGLVALSVLSFAMDRAFIQIIRRFFPWLPSS